MVRPIRLEDNARVAEIIRLVMPEFGACGEGFAIHDDEVDAMFEAYQVPRSLYVVYEEDGIVYGGGGIAPLQGGDEDTCELKKMYFLSEARNKGVGRQVLEHCIHAARALGYRRCYLETFHTMTAAMKLYERLGFSRIPESQGNTGHFGCNTFYLLSL